MCEGENVFYIPSTDEILWITVIKDETPTFHGLSFEDIDSDLEKVIKEQIAGPVEIFKDYKKFSNETLRMVNYNWAFNLESNSLKLLEYFTMINRVFAYHFLISKLDSTSFDLRLEETVFQGEDYWAEKSISKIQNVGGSISNWVIS